MIRTSVLARNAALDALAELASAGSVRIWDGKRPGSLEADSKAQMLAELRLDSPAFQKARSGSIRAREIDKEPSARAGLASWFQVVTAAGEVLFDGDVTGRGNGGACEMDHLTIQGGADVTIGTLVYTLPE